MKDPFKEKKNKKITNQTIQEEKLKQESQDKLDTQQSETLENESKSTIIRKPLWKSKPLPQPISSQTSLHSSLSIHSNSQFQPFNLKTEQRVENRIDFSKIASQKLDDKEKEKRDNELKIKIESSQKIQKDITKRT